MCVTINHSNVPILSLYAISIPMESILTNATTWKGGETWKLQ